MDKWFVNRGDATLKPLPMLRQWVWCGIQLIGTHSSSFNVERLSARSCDTKYSRCIQTLQTMMVSNLAIRFIDRLTILARSLREVVKTSYSPYSGDAQFIN